MNKRLRLNEESAHPHVNIIPCSLSDVIFYLVSFQSIKNNDENDVPRATGKKHKGFRVNKMETLVVCKSQWKSYLTRNGWMRVWISPYCDDVFLIIICFIFTINRHCYAAQLWLLGLVSPVHHVVLTLSAPPKSEEWVCSAAAPPRNRTSSTHLNVIRYLEIKLYNATIQRQRRKG
jgi:hypothetical protein